MHIYTEKIYRKPIDYIRINKNIIFRNRNKKSKKKRKKKKHFLRPAMILGPDLLLLSIQQICDV